MLWVGSRASGFRSRKYLPVSMNRSHHLRVLLVEDNELDARKMRSELRGSSDIEVTVDRVVDLSSARRSIQESFYDCILLDLSLPDSHGLVAVDALIADDPDVPIVVLTGLDDPVTAEEAVNRGAQDYLIKGAATADVVSRSIRYAVARHHSDSQLRTTREMLELVSERERIARELHDTVIQQLFATGMGLQAASNGADEAMKTKLLDAVDGIDASIRQLREAIFELHELTPEAGLAEMVDRVVSEQKDALGFMATVRIGSIGEVSPALLRDIAAVVREGLANVAKHARATAAEVVINLDGADLELTITDNGTGLASPYDISQSRSGHGLRNIAFRAREWGGSFDVALGPGGGTCLTWRVPKGG